MAARCPLKAHSREQRGNAINDWDRALMLMAAALIVLPETDGISGAHCFPTMKCGRQPVSELLRH